MPNIKDNPSIEVHTNGTVRQANVPIAIVGMASIFPESRTLAEYWDNIFKKVDCIIEVPISRWNLDEYYDPDPKAPDKTYCKYGGFIPDVEFDPLEFGLPPNILEVTDMSQLLSLVIAKEALADAGYADSDWSIRERTGIILGVGGARPLISQLASRLQYPIWEKVLKNSGLSDDDTEKVIEKMKLAYVRWEENTFPGMLGNVIAGRIANRLDLGGINCTVDAACASSLSALQMGISELAAGRSDMIITGGVDTDNSVFTYLCFSKTPAFSPSDVLRPFDAKSDGMMIGEGIGMVVLKRLADAERDGNRIYAVIKGIGSSSDGRYKSIYAPRSEGQERALVRAYEEAGLSPLSVDLIEAHGTGTAAGDLCEVTTLNRFYRDRTDAIHQVALGSVKSQIGHTKSTAGAASLIKVALALHHKVLPPTINVSTPHPKMEIEQSPLYLNTETRPWIRAASASPRRAGVSSFGFGGTNFHTVLEEYEREHEGAYRMNDVAQPIILSADTPAALLVACEEARAQLIQQTDVAFAELVASKTQSIAQNAARVGFVVDSAKEAVDYLNYAISMLNSQPEATAWQHPKGVHYRQSGLGSDHKVVALFPGQGAQYVNMGIEVALNFPMLREAYGALDDLFIADGQPALSEVVFPPPVWSDQERVAQSDALRHTEYAQPAIGSFSFALYKMLQDAGFQPDFTAGHSFGELTALWAAGVLSDQDYHTLIRARGKAMAPPARSFEDSGQGFDAGGMLAVTGDVSNLADDMASLSEVKIANWNSHKQAVVAGPTAMLPAAEKRLKEKGYHVTFLPVSAAFHTPLVAHAQKPFAEVIDSVTFNAPTIPVYSNTTAQPYPNQPQEIQAMLAEQILNSVQFTSEIENIYANGGHLFVEVGPRSILSNLVQKILADRPHVTIALNASRKKDSDRQLRDAVVQLRVAGLSLDTIDPYQMQPAAADQAPRKKKLSVMLNGANYVSPKTKATFEKALQNGHKISIPSSNGNGHNGHKNQPTSSQSVSPAPRSRPSSNGTTYQAKPTNGSPAPARTAIAQVAAPRAMPALTPVSVMNNPAPVRVANSPSVAAVAAVAPAKLVAQTRASTPKAGSATQPSVAQPVASTRSALPASTPRSYLKERAQLSHQMQSTTISAPQATKSVVSGSGTTQMVTNSADVHRLLDTLERTIEHISTHQSETYRTHEQYLGMEKEYASTFFKLMEQQQGLILNRATPPEPRVLESLSKSMKLFHSHQNETLRAHELYLSQQAQYTGSFFTLVQAALAAARPTLTSGVVEVPTITTSAKVIREEVAPTKEIAAEVAPAPTARIAAEVAPVTRMVAKAPAAPVPTAQAALSPVPTTKVVEVPAPVSTAQAAPPPAAAPTAQVADSSPASGGVDTQELTNALLEVVSDKTGYPVEMLELEMDMESDLGIDSIKRVEILGTLQERYPEMPKLKPEELAELRTLGQIVEHTQASMGGAAEMAAEATQVAQVAHASAPAAAPSTSSGVDTQELTNALLEVVSDKTGYPVEMLELEMDMESDLGIDSIKRVEILGTLQDRYPEMPKLKPEELGELRTLGQIVEHTQASMGGAAEMAAEATQVAQVAHASAPATAPSTSSGVDTQELTNALLEVVSDKTGYPVEMLELEMDMESDLGIDSIKRVEILGTLQDRYPEMPKLKPEELGELRTLGQIVEHTQASMGGAAEMATETAETAEAVDSPAPAAAPSTSSGVDTQELTNALLEVVSDKTGYPVEMLELEMDMESDLGIDSIKRVEILGTLQERYPEMPKLKPEELGELRTLGQIVEHTQASMGGAAEMATETAETAEAVDSPAPAAAPSTSSGVDTQELTNALLEVVSDKTGYPVEMLELEMDMESDLGIDSIKRVEILGTLQDRYPEMPKLKPEELGELRTLGQIVEHTQASMGGAAEMAAEMADPGAEVVDSGAAEAEETVPDHGISRSEVRLKPLPAPDVLELSLPAGRICLLTDDGSAITSHLAHKLAQLNWPVVVLSWPQETMVQAVNGNGSPIIKMPEGVTHVQLPQMSEEQLSYTLKEIEAQYGPVGAFVHLNPVAHSTEKSNGTAFSETEKSIVKQVFLMAKHLKESLNHSALEGYGSFVSVTRLDGELGLAQQNGFGSIGGGLFGLTKTVNLEWEPVHCRAVDIDPQIEAEHAAHYILAELHDPNRLIVEVAYGQQGRVTLVKA